ncbi:CopG family transcriptional regulator [Inhella proteolytica]|uniref:CopG family transcriptional regulator n=1 Tax=Inhella proteolytica TaxID=2795029 RepID=A0A931NIM4_9BURK|nr:CopG family transcriptional regulator [Inhella proteolytica]MBH9579018.1 CopG family transcriptional regulator [Inhella proteolytica]
MRNVTITMEDAVADWARMEAARRNTSVSRLVGELLAEKMRHDDAYERGMREALEFKSFGESTGRYFSRDEIYDRKAQRT